MLARLLAYAQLVRTVPGSIFGITWEIPVAFGMLGFDTATEILKALQAGRKVLVTAFPYNDSAPRSYVEDAK